MAGYQKKRLALDSNLLLDLARGLNFAHDFHAVFRAANYSLMVGPTVFSELELTTHHCLRLHPLPVFLNQIHQAIHCFGFRNVELHRILAHV